MIEQVIVSENSGQEGGSQSLSFSGGRIRLQSYIVEGLCEVFA